MLNLKGIKGIIMKKTTILIFIFFLTAVSAFTQTESRFSFVVTPGYELTLPYEYELFENGVNANLDFEYRIFTNPRISAVVDLGYTYLPIISGDLSHIIFAGGGIDYGLPRIGGKLESALFLNGGYYYGVIAEEENSAGGNLFASGGLRLSWPFSPDYELGLEVRYKALADGYGNLLYHGLCIGLSNLINIHQRGMVKIFNINLQ